MTPGVGPVHSPTPVLNERANSAGRGSRPLGTSPWSTSARLRSIYRPGSDLYIVYDEVRRDINGIPIEEFRDRRLIIKATYLLSM